MTCSAEARYAQSSPKDSILHIVFYVISEGEGTVGGLLCEKMDRTQHPLSCKFIAESAEASAWDETEESR
jgi:hypothetical protein